MIEDHDQFIDDVISEVTNKINKDETDKSRREKEQATVDSLMEVTGMPRADIKKIMERKRNEQMSRQSNLKVNYTRKKNNQSHRDNSIYVKLIFALVALIIVFFVLNNFNVINVSNIFGSAKNWEQVDGLSRIAEENSDYLLEKGITEIRVGKRSRIYNAGDKSTSFISNGKTIKIPYFKMMLFFEDMKIVYENEKWKVYLWVHSVKYQANGQSNWMKVSLGKYGNSSTEFNKRFKKYFKDLIKNGL